jgi:hypothetical protein
MEEDPEIAVHRSGLGADFCPRTPLPDGFLSSADIKADLLHEGRGLFYFILFLGMAC